MGHKKSLVEKPWEVLEVFGKFQESAQLQKACQLLNNINDIDNINDMFFDKDIGKYFYNDEFYIILIFGRWKT